MMPTLAIHHPQDEADQNGRQSFEDCCKSGVGKGFAIPLAKARGLQAMLTAGARVRVVILCKTPRHQRRAEGTLIRLIDSGERTNSGLIRYNVHIKDIEKVAYLRNDVPKLSHTGIAVF